MNLKQLRAQAKLRKIPKYWVMNKSQLIQVLEDETVKQYKYLGTFYLDETEENFINILDEPIPEINVPIMKPSLVKVSPNSLASLAKKPWKKLKILFNPRLINFRLGLYRTSRNLFKKLLTNGLNY